MLSSVQVPINWKSNIEQVVAGYETEPAKGLIHGFQKDSIQNSWGARATKKGKGWGTRFQLIENKLGTFLTIEDWGTTGMTGPNMSMSQINQLKGDLPADYKLARFSAMNYSGNNDGPGLFGRGKMLFSAVSKDYYFFFETLTKEEGYRANYKRLEGNNLKVGEIALEGDEARQLIIQNTGINPIERVGSRIIIVNPIRDLVKSIKDGSFLKAIEETWWRIIEKYDASIYVEFDGISQKAKTPSLYKEALAEKNGWKAWKKKGYQVPDYYKIKRIELFVSKSEIDPELAGVYFYRKDMKIGSIDLEVPKKIRNKYFGFVEVDQDWEEELAANESLEHYGVKSKARKCYQKLKNEVANQHKLFMEELGFFKKEQSDNEILRRELEEISQSWDNLFSTMNIGNIGNRGPKKEKIIVSWSGLQFPTSRKGKLYTGDKIDNINFKIKNNTGTKIKIKYKLNVLHGNNVVKVIDTGDFELAGSTEEMIGPFDLLIGPPLVKFEKNILNLEISYFNKTITKQIPLYYDTEPVQTPQHNFYVRNISMDFPQQESKRVNSNETIKSIKYEIENNTSETAFIAFHLSTHNAERSNELIETILLKKDFVLGPYQIIEVDCPDIFFRSDIYESKLYRGKIEIRARISAAQDFGEYETADLLSKGSKITVFFNQDPDGVGSTFSDFRTFTHDSTKRSDAYKEDGNWVFYFYEKHPSYQMIADDEHRRKSFLDEEILKQMIRVHIEEGNYSILNIDSDNQNDEKTIGELSPSELIQKTYNIIDLLNYKRLKGEIHGKAN